MILLTSSHARSLQGQIEDQETGMFYNRHRYYDPDEGQYISPDPIGLAGGLNPYAYTSNSVSWVDPLGLSGQKDCPGESASSGFTKLSSQSRRYLNDLEEQAGFKVNEEQRAHLADALREQEFTKLSRADAKVHRNEFNRVKDNLISQWEQNTGQVWPRYTEDVMSKSGQTIVRKAGRPYDAHHIIESSYGGPNQW